MAIKGRKCHFLVFALSVEEAEFTTRPSATEKKRFFGADALARKERKEVAFTVYLRKGGRVTVPKEVRDALTIEDGDLVECRIKKTR